MKLGWDDRIGTAPALLKMDISATSGSANRFTSASGLTLGGKRSSTSTYVTAKSARSSLATFQTAVTDLHGKTRGSTLSRFNTLSNKLLCNLVSLSAN